MMQLPKQALLCLTFVCRLPGDHGCYSGLIINHQIQCGVTLISRYFNGMDNAGQLGRLLRMDPGRVVHCFGPQIGAPDRTPVTKVCSGRINKPGGPGRNSPWGHPRHKGRCHCLS